MNPKVVEDGALRRPRPRRAGGTYAVQRLTTLVAPLHAALHGAARRVPPHFENDWRKFM